MDKGNPERIIWPSAMPRSGTNWISQILASCPDVRLKFCPLFSHEFKNARDESSSAQQWKEFFSEVYKTPGDYLDQEYLRREGWLPDFTMKQHDQPVLAIKSTRFHHLSPVLLEKVDNLSFVFLIRNPAAAIFSWLDNPMEFPAQANPLQQWRTGQVRKTAKEEFWGFDDWVFVAKQALKLHEKFPERTCIFRYEAFVQDIVTTSQMLFDQLHLEMTEQTLNFLHESQHRHCDHKRSVFKKPGSVERWRQQLDKSIIREIEETLRDTELELFLEPIN